jgi:hypothetical protein
MRIRRTTAALALPALALALGACGGSDDSSTTTVDNGATVPKTTGGSLPSPLVPGSSPTTPGQTPPAGGEPKTVYGSLPSPVVPGGSGRGRQPAPIALAFVVKKGQLSPARREIEAFTPFDLKVTAGDRDPHVVVVHAGSGRILRPRPGVPAVVRLRGLRAGTYTLTAGNGRAQIISH